MRVRITFSKGQEIKYISHLDLLRMWERILRRAGVCLAYSKGFNPHPKLALAAPLPVGLLASAEMLEMHLEQPMPLDELQAEIERQLPLGVRISRVEEVDPSGPSLPSTVTAVEYEASVADGVSRHEVEERIGRLLSTPQLLRERKTDKGVRKYDLRPLVEDVRIDRWNGERIVRMRLRASAGGTGRPEEVLEELHLTHAVTDITRTKLLVSQMVQVDNLAIDSTSSAATR